MKHLKVSKVEHAQATLFFVKQNGSIDPSDSKPLSMCIAARGGWLVALE